MNELRAACAAVAERARFVDVQPAPIEAYAASLAREPRPPAVDPEAEVKDGTTEHRAAFWLTLDAINFGSGWFPTLRKPDGRSGYHTIAAGVRARFEADGPWPAQELASLDAAQIAQVLGQDYEHELMGLYAASLCDLGTHVSDDYDGSFAALALSTGGSAVSLAGRLGAWSCFEDVSTYDELRLPFLKRAQIAAADLARACVIAAADLDRLTIFADNLVPHVLRLDGILRFDDDLSRRIERGTLIEHGSAEEVEIRACALHAVELIVAAEPRWCAAEVDQLLWRRGQQPRYKAVPRHRSRCTAY